MRISTQHITLFLHIISLGVGLYILWKVALYRPFGAALCLDGLTGSGYYVAILFLGAPGHELSVSRSIIHAAVWAFFGIGIILFNRVKNHDNH